VAIVPNLGENLRLALKGASQCKLPTKWFAFLIGVPDRHRRIELSSCSQRNWGPPARSNEVCGGWTA